MFSKLKEFFDGTTTLEVDKSGEATDKDLQIATAVLLLEMAGSDDDYAPEEVQECFAIMEKQFNISDSETLEIMEKADSLREDSDKIDEFVAIVNDKFNEKQRQLILAMIWKIILADDIVEKYEQRFATQLRTRLKLSREQAEAAKNTAFGGHL